MGILDWLFRVELRRSIGVLDTELYLSHAYKIGETLLLGGRYGEVVRVVGHRRGHIVQRGMVGTLIHKWPAHTIVQLVDIR